MVLAPLPLRAQNNLDRWEDSTALGVLEEIDRFKKEVMGEKNVSIECLAQQSDSLNYPDFYESVETMKNRPLEGHFRTFVPDVGDADACQPEIVEGALHRHDANLRDYHQRALDIKRRVEDILHDMDIESERRKELLTLYIDGILFPMRGLVVQQLEPVESVEQVQKRALYKDLLLEIPRDLKQMPLPDGISSRDGRTYFNIMAVQKDVEFLSAYNPTADSYVKALQTQALLVHMRQLKDYNYLLGKKNESIEIPDACHSPIDPLDRTFPSHSDEVVRERFLLERILVKQGLISPYSSTYPTEDSIFGKAEYFENFDGYQESLSLEDIGYTPNEKIGLGIDLTPFEEYSYAEKGLEMLQSYQGYSENLPDISDGETVFNQIRETKEQNYVANFTPMPFLSLVRSFLTGEPIRLFHGIQIFRKLFPLSADQPGSEDGISSEYLRELMTQREVYDPMDLLSDSLQIELENREVVLEMPSLYSPTAWKRWGLESLSYFAGESLKLNERKFHSIEMAVRGACSIHPNSPRGSKDWQYKKGIEHFCRGFSSRQTLQRVQAFINNLHIQGKDSSLVLLSRHKEQEFIEEYPFLRKLWRSFKKYNSFRLVDSMKEMYGIGISEYEFLANQIDFYRNPWAIMRLGYLLAVDDIKGLKEPSTWRTPYRIRAFNQSIDIILERFQQAAASWGIDRPITNVHANSVLTLSEKEDLWSKIISNHNRTSSLLFSQSMDAKSTHEHLMDLSYEYLLTKGDVENYVRQRPYLNSILDDSTKEEMDNISISTEEEMLVQIYRSQGELNREQENFIRDAQYSAAEDLIHVDNRFKLPLFRSLMKESASLKREDIIRSMESLCSFDLSVHGDRRAAFHGLINIQNELNQTIGLPEVPKEIIDEIESWDPREVNIMIAVGVMMFALMPGIVAMTSATSCAGGACALLIKVALALSPIAGGAQLYILQKELELFSEAGHHEKILELFEDLYLTESGSSGEVSRSILFPAIEVLGIVGIFGIVGRSLHFLTRLSVSTVRSPKKDLSFRKIYRELEIELAQSLLGRQGRNRTPLGLSELVKQLSEGNASRQAIGIWADRTFGNMSVDFSSIDQIDQAVASKVSNYFDNDPRKMSRLIRSYRGRRMRKAKRWIGPDNEPRAQAERPISGRIPFIGKFVVGPFRTRQSVQNLVSYGQKIEKITDELLKLPQIEGALERYIIQNVEDLTDIFMHLPYRKRDMPHLVFLQGGYHHLLARMKSPRLGWNHVSDGIVIEQFFRSRSRLVYEVLTKQAKERLGLSPEILKTSPASTTFRHFIHSYKTAFDKASHAGKMNLENSFNTFQEDISRRVFESLGAKNFSISNKTYSFENAEDYKKLLFNVDSFEGIVFSRQLWESINVQKVFQLRETKDLAHKIAEEWRDYKSPTEFQYYIDALKVLLTKEDPLLIDIL